VRACDGCLRFFPSETVTRPGGDGDTDESAGMFCEGRAWADEDEDEAANGLSIGIATERVIEAYWGADEQHLRPFIFPQKKIGEAYCLQCVL
jgi:hypothetical protein